MNKVKKRDGSLVEFDESKIRIAITNANRDVAQNEKANEVVITRAVNAVKSKAELKALTVEEIQDIVEETLMQNQLFALARAYIVFRYEKALIRKSTSVDQTILEIVRGKNDYWLRENSNKNALIASTQRDNIAGAVSKDISERLLLPNDVVKAHEEGVLHFHDLDYFIQRIFNCCLINIKDMLDNGTVINNKAISSPNSFQVACTVTTQIIASVASHQYGGQSVNISHLGKYLQKSEDKYREIVSSLLHQGKPIELHKDVAKVKEEIKPFLKQLKGADVAPEFLEELQEALVKILLQKELSAGIQTIQYQINTLMTTNGQSPFVTLFMYLDDNDPYIDYAAKIIQEILEQRIAGIENAEGVNVTPAFPKLVYVLDENNCLQGGKYDDLTRLAVKCSAERMYPDYISAKKMRETYGDVFSCMGCRSFLSPWKDENGKLKWEGRFNQGVVSINLPQIGILAKGDMDTFWELLEQRLALCFKALMCRHEALKGTPASISPIHWQYGAIARLKDTDTIDKYLMDGYSTLSLGYIGLYELSMAMLQKSHTTEEGKEFTLKVLKRLRNACESWKETTGLGFSLYGTPAESLCYRFCEIDKKRFGEIPNVTDKGWYTNSYHVDVREHISAFDKLSFESLFQEISTGGAISYVEVPNMQHNQEALEEVVKFIYDHIRYAEFNSKSDNCMECGYSGEIKWVDGGWECPNCGCRTQSKLNVTRRTCGYLGENFWNAGKSEEISQRVLHL